MTLDEFLNREDEFPNNAFVDEPGFRELYVRDTWRCIDNVKTKVFDIARVEVKKKGNGTFTALVNRLKSKHNLYVECVTTGHFQKLLRHLGFTKVDYSNGGFPSYYLEKQP